MRYHECAARVIRLELDKISYQRRRTFKWHKYTRILMDHKKDLCIKEHILFHDINPIISCNAKMSEISEIPEQQSNKIQ